MMWRVLTLCQMKYFALDTFLVKISGMMIFDRVVFCFVDIRNMYQGTGNTDILISASAYRPYLSSHVNGTNDYINAVSLPVSMLVYSYSF